MNAPRTRILIAESRYYPAISDAALEGAVLAARAAECDWDVVTLTGILELPPAIAMAEAGGRGPSGVRYDGFVALACVMRDQVVGNAHILEAAIQGLVALSVERNLAIGLGMVDVDTELDGLRWAGEADGGGAAVRSCMELISLKKRLLGA